MKVKICGVRTAEAVARAAAGGAAYLGFNFYPPSPRSVSVETARELAANTPQGIVKVALVVDADDALIERIMADVDIDMLQLHGSEPPERVTELKAKFGCKVMKVVGIREPGDVERITLYEPVADQLLIDAKPPREAGFLPGGNALSFDWRLLAGRAWAKPWMLAGGLVADNLAEAVRLTGASQLDVSSGVESAPGVKDLAKISAFLRAARAVEAPAG